MILPRLFNRGILREIEVKNGEMTLKGTQGNVKFSGGGGGGLPEVGQLGNYLAYSPTKGSEWKDVDGNTVYPRMTTLYDTQNMTTALVELFRQNMRDISDLYEFTTEGEGEGKYTYTLVFKGSGDYPTFFQPAFELRGYAPEGVTVTSGEARAWIDFNRYVVVSPNEPIQPNETLTVTFELSAPINTKYSYSISRVPTSSTYRAFLALNLNTAHIPTTAGENKLATVTSFSVLENGFPATDNDIVCCHVEIMNDEEPSVLIADGYLSTRGTFISINDSMDLWFNFSGILGKEMVGATAREQFAVNFAYNPMTQEIAHSAVNITKLG